jgi:hypothetical protein
MKQNELIDVLTDDGTIGLARVVEGKGCYVTVQFLNRIRKNTYAFDYDSEEESQDMIKAFYQSPEFLFLKPIDSAQLKLYLEKLYRVFMIRMTCQSLECIEQ